MKVAVLGTGMVGQAHAAKLHELGHEVFVGTHKPAETLKKPGGQMTRAYSEFQKDYPKIKLVTFAEAAAQGEIIVEAISAQGVLKVLKSTKKQLKGKVLIDLTNPLDFSGGSVKLFVVNTDSLGEQIQKALPDTKVVKAFNTMNAAIQVDPSSLAKGDHHLFIAGDDSQAKKQVTKLAKDYGWKNILDLGDITAARGLEMVFILWMKIYGTTQTPQFNYKIVN